MDAPSRPFSNLPGEIAKLNAQLAMYKSLVAAQRKQINDLMRQNTRLESFNRVLNKEIS